MIANGKLGYCGVRKTIDGKLYSLIYGKVSSACSDAIGPYLDAYRVDIKGLNGYKEKESSETEIKVNSEFQDSRHFFYRDFAKVKSVKPILDAAIRTKTRWNMHV